MSYSKKGMLALLRDLMERERRHLARLAEAGSVVRTGAKTAAPTLPLALAQRRRSSSSGHEQHHRMS